jgi:hypothetical protein
MLMLLNDTEPPSASSIEVMALAEKATVKARASAENLIDCM